MTALDKIAYLQRARNEVPNQELAKDLAQKNNIAGIREIADNLFNKDRNIQSDCIKVMYEIGYIKPGLICDYVGDFLRLLKSNNNRLVWGAMIAISVIAPLKADELFPSLDDLYKAISEGSVITVDNGIKALAAIASQKEEYIISIFPYLLNHLKTCRPKTVGQHSESIFAAVNTRNKDAFIETLRYRENSLTDSQLARVRKLYKAAEKI